MLTAFEEISETDALSIVINSNTTSCELDPIPTFLLKQCIHELLPVLTRIINLSIKNAEMPKVYKKAIIRPLLKKPNLNQVLSNYRPVSNLSYVSKLIERAICTQFKRHLHVNGLNETFQSAYRAFHSTETALVKVFDDILNHMDNGNAVFMALLDLSAAFDTVDHRILLRRLENSMMVSGSALDWFRSYLTERTTCVCVNGEYSDEVQVECSVPQGSILGPGQYSVYTSPLGSLIGLLLLLHHFYADDTQIWKPVNPRCIKDHATTASHIEHGIEEIASWMYDNKLKLNQNKTEFVILGSSHCRRQIVVDRLHLEDGDLSAINVVKNLGVKMDTSLTMRDQINSIRKSGFYYLNWIRKIRPYLTLQTAKCIVHALVICRIDYCNSLLVNLPASAIRSLQGLMNAAARVVTMSPRQNHITPVLQALHWLPVRQRIDFKVLTMTYKALHGEAPPYISELLEEYKPVRNLRSASKAQLVVPRVKLKYGQRRFSYAGPSLWNSLPYHIRASKSLRDFKRNLKTYLFVRSEA